MLSPGDFSDLQAAFARLPADMFVRRCEVVTRTHDDDSRVWFLFGAAYHRLGQIERALHAFDNVLVRDPDHISAMNAKAGILVALNRRVEARALLEATCERFPHDPATLSNLGYFLEEEPGETGKALTLYDRALKADPSNRSALTNRGYLLTLTGQLIEALINNRELAARYPEDAVAHFNLAESLLAALRPADALAACDRAIAIDPHFSKPHLTRALALSELGRREDAARSFQRLHLLDPGAIERVTGIFEQNPTMAPPPVDPDALYLNRGFIHLNACEWSRRDEFLRNFESRIGETIARGGSISDYSFAYSMLATDLSPELHRGVTGTLARQFEQKANESHPVPYHFEPSEKPRIRIGYLSPDFRDHLNARLTLPIYRRHDRNRFEVHCYSLHEDDGSDIRRAVADAADQFADVSALTSAAIAERIHADGIDILVDLAGITRFARPDILAFQPAPLQVSYLGFPGTLGANYIQYRITDRVATPPSQRSYWSEKLVFLGNTFYIYDESEPLASVPVSRSDYGLPDGAMVFCAFHNFYKIDPEIFAVWMRILDRVPDSVLWMMGDDVLARDNLRRSCDGLKINPERVVFAPRESRERYRARFALADLYLDTRNFTAMTTACDALWAGLPMVACPGSSFPSRVSASLLAAAGLNDCILPSLHAYEEQAVRLAIDSTALQSLKDRVARNRLATALFDSAQRVKELEAAFEGMWQRHLRGASPEDFDVALQD